MLNPDDYFLKLSSVQLSSVTQSCPTLLQPHGLQTARLLCPQDPPRPRARILEWVAISFSRGSSQPKDRIHVSCIGRQILYC